MGGNPHGQRESGRPEGDACALEEFEFHWGSAYHLAVIDGVCTAWRKDGRGGTLADPLPEGLLTAACVARLCSAARAGGAREGTP
jgi:hypothetical protein